MLLFIIPVCLSLKEEENRILNVKSEVCLWVVGCEVVVTAVKRRLDMEWVVNGVDRPTEHDVRGASACLGELGELEVCECVC